MNKKYEYDIERIVKGLFYAYPMANFIALNSTLSQINQNDWRDSWYFIGFDEEPIYKEIEGYPKWVADESISLARYEWGLFTLHISSRGYSYRGAPLQHNFIDFASSRTLCWKRGENDEIIQLVADEIEVKDAGDGVVKSFADGISESLKQHIDIGITMTKNEY